MESVISSSTRSGAAKRAAETFSDPIFRLLVESVRDYAIFMLTPDGHVATWSAGAQRIKGYTAEDIIGVHFSRFYPREAVARKWPDYELEMALKHGRFEDEGWRVRKDGSLFWANVVITAVYDEDGELRGFAKVTRDLTERMRYEQKLRESEERLRLLINSATEHAIYMLDENGIIVSWNAGAERLKGYTAHEIIGKHFSRLYPPEALERNWPDHELEVARLQGRFEDEGWRVRKDGSRFWANVVITPVQNEAGELRGFAKVTRDLTERNRVIAMQTSQQHMDEFLAMLGHELRNPLGAITNASSVVKKIASAGPLQTAAGVLDRQTRQMSRIVDDLLDVARIREGKFVIRKMPLDLAEALRAAVESVSLVQEKSQHLDLSLPNEPLVVAGDNERLTQTFVNILNNAAKYTDEHGRISITLQRDGREAVVSFKDNGKGIEPELLPNVFDLFRQGERTLRNAEGGLGLGLTLVQRIVNLHGGTVQAFSRGLQQGSEFIVRLPMID